MIGKECVRLGELHPCGGKSYFSYMGILLSEKKKKIKCISEKN